MDRGAGARRRATLTRFSFYLGHGPALSAELLLLFFGGELRKRGTGSLLEVKRIDVTHLLYDLK